MKVVKVNEALLNGIEWGAVPKYSRVTALQTVSENVYRLDIQADGATDLSREFIIAYFEVIKPEPPANVILYYSHMECEDRPSKGVRWRIVRKSYPPLDRDIKQTIINRVIWTWGRYSLDANAPCRVAVKEMNPEKVHPEVCNEESNRNVRWTDTKGAAAHIGWNVSTLRQRKAAGTIPSDCWVKVLDGFIRWDLEAIDKWMESMK